VDKFYQEVLLSVCLSVSSLPITKKLQCVQTSVARAVLPNLSQQPATALLSELHWLPVNSRITFKLARLTHHRSTCLSVHTTTPLYPYTGQLHPVMRSLSLDAAKMLAQAFISSSLDYCNSTLYGITNSLFRRLQAVQYATACLITGVQCKSHITPILQQLHWLPVRERVMFKHALLFSRRCTVCCRRISRMTVSC